MESSSTVLTRKSGLSQADAAQRIEEWATSFPTVDTTASILRQAAAISAGHQLGIFDAVVVAAAAAAGCDTLYSEDLHDGFRWRGVTVVNPFTQTA